MFTQTFSIKGLGKLCPDFSKIAFVFLMVIVGFAAPKVQGQVVVIVVDIEGFSSESTTTESGILSDNFTRISLTTSSQIDIYPNPFNTELTIKASEEEGLNYLELKDENGTIIWERNVFSIPDKYMIESLNPGTYYLSLSLSGGTHTETIVYQP